MIMTLLKKILGIKSGKYLHPRKCKRRGLEHVYRFNRYCGAWIPHDGKPSRPKRLPTKGVFRCVECGDEIITPIRHKP